MYEQHFNLNQPPFSIAPDPSFLYLSESHGEALAHLKYGFSHGGFVMITGEVGTGKTMLLRNLLQQTPQDIDVAFILNPRLTVRELLETLCEELGVPFDASKVSTVKQYIDLLTRYLLRTHRAGRSTVMIIDEAQNLSPAVLEQVRLLTNLETDERKLLRIILIGQPELADLLDRQDLRQLAQRITARYHLGSLNRPDTYAYVMHRLSRAGGNPHLFSPSALRRLFRLSRGTPRVINVIADRALLGAYVEGDRQVAARIVSRAAREVLGKTTDRRRWLAAAAVALSVAGATWAFLGPNPLSNLDAGYLPDRPQLDPGAEETTPVIPQDAEPDPAIANPSPPAPPPDNVVTEQQDPQDEVITPQTYALNQQRLSMTAGVELERNPQSEEASFSEPATTGTLHHPSGSAFANRRLAYSAVFKRWGVDFESASNQRIPCDFAPSAGLQCLSRQDNWESIRQLDLPVVMELQDADAAPYHVALIRLQASNVELQVADQRLATSEQSLLESWSGSYVVLWQTPPGYYGSLRSGQTHETVGWLRQQLSGLTSRSLASASPDFFDDQLHQAVLEFQQTEGLLTDGVVGPDTWIKLAERLELPQPSLAG